MSAWSMLASAFCRGRRVPRTGFKQLTSKIGPRTYYKGKGCAPTGRNTRKGRLLITFAIRLGIFLFLKFVFRPCYSAC